jgi:hypothetical protein
MDGFGLKRFNFAAVKLWRPQGIRSPACDNFGGQHRRIRVELVNDLGKLWAKISCAKSPVWIDSSAPAHCSSRVFKVLQRIAN